MEADRRRRGAAWSALKRQCSHPPCERYAVSKRLCSRHGGGRRCQIDQCTNGTVGSSNLCFSHGGGQRCAVAECNRSTSGRTRYCATHTTSMGVKPLRVLTQNVCGLKKRLVDPWVQSLGCYDIAFLQETRVRASEAMESAVTRVLGDKYYSVWTEGDASSSGVAIVARYPLTAWRRSAWTPRVMAATMEADGATLLLVNIYAPCGGSNYRERQALFVSLAELTRGHAGLVILAGDFNNTLDGALDRSHPVPKRPAQHSPALTHLLVSKEWSGCAFTHMSTAGPFTFKDFHDQHHAYYYPRHGVIDGASARLDRIYVTTRHAHFVRAVTRVRPVPPLSSDHYGVVVQLAPW